MQGWNQGFCHCSLRLETLLPSAAECLTVVYTEGDQAMHAMITKRLALKEQRKQLQEEARNVMQKLQIFSINNNKNKHYHWGIESCGRELDQHAQIMKS